MFPGRRRKGVFMIGTLIRQSENLTRGTDFFTHIKVLIQGLSVKPEIFTVSGQAAQYFLYLRRPPKSGGNHFNKLKNQYNYG